MPKDNDMTIEEHEYRSDIKVDKPEREDIVQVPDRSGSKGVKPADDADEIDFNFVDMTVDEENSNTSSGEALKTQNPQNFSKSNTKSQQTTSSDTSEAAEGVPSGRALQTQNTAVSKSGGEAGETVRLGDRLIEMGLITEGQLKVALQEQRMSGVMLGQALIDVGFLTEEQLTLALADSAGFEVFDPKSFIMDGAALEILTKAEALKLNILPLSFSDDMLQIAVVDPYDIVSMDTFKRKAPKGITIKPMVTTPLVINEAIDAAYGYSSSIEGILKALEADDLSDTDISDLSEDEAFTHPIVRLVNALLLEAVKMGVSDLHFEPEENFIRVRYRLDGILFSSHILHKKYWNGISQRIKIASEMNIADKLSPQDGRFSLNVGGKEADFRVSSLPTVHGENIVMRVLDKSTSIMPLGDLGFSDENLEKIRKSQSKPEGIVIVTGPTGSGKSTSLYAMLNHINSVEINIQTLEDPVEYSLPMIRQTSVREGVLGFGDGIKALLRQDPDIIFIGEVRDKVTAEMALKAAMTGHQVYTTLHTNDSFGAIPRLLDLGLKPGMVAGAIVSIFAQRLGRRLCSNC